MTGISTAVLQSLAEVAFIVLKLKTYSVAKAKFTSES